MKDILINLRNVTTIEKYDPSNKAGSYSLRFDFVNRDVKFASFYNKEFRDHAFNYIKENPDFLEFVK